MSPYIAFDPDEKQALVEKHNMKKKENTQLKRTDRQDDPKRWEAQHDIRVLSEELKNEIEWLEAFEIVRDFDELKASALMIQAINTQLLSVLNEH